MRRAVLLVAVLLVACSPAEPRHDDGAGIPPGCAGGYHDGGDGACVAAETCSPGYHDGGFGTCVALGSCSYGHHDGGDGQCLGGDACAAGFHDTGGFTCKPVGTPCDPGYLERTGVCVAWDLLGGPYYARYDEHAAVLLADGRVLVTGGTLVGYGVSASTTATAWDAATRQFSPVAPMLTARRRHAAIRLADGRVLVAGGIGTGTAVPAVELYDPAVDRWSAGPAWPTTGNRGPAGGASVSVLPDGRVLVAGGCDSTRSAFSVRTLIVDVVASRATWGAAMGTARCEHAAVTLGDGRVLVCGGASTGGQAALHCEVYDPDLDRWAPAAPMTYARRVIAAASLPDGSVLVAGAFDALVWNPATNAWRWSATFSPTGGPVRATVLPSGRVLVTHGHDGGYGPTARVYDPTTERWLLARPMPQGWFDGHSATALDDGSVVVLGGGHGFQYVGGL